MLSSENSDDITELAHLVARNAFPKGSAVLTMRDKLDQIFEDKAFGPLRDQKMTETFVESAEPLCWPDPDADEDELDEVVTLREFLELWAEGFYDIRVDGDDGEKVFGETFLSHDLPAAPADVDFDGTFISWLPGNDLGHCAPLADEGYGVETVGEVADLIPNPATVTVAAWEVVM